MSETTCLRCPRGLVPQRTWQKATSAQRAAWLAESKTVHQARGLCRACYLKAYRAGEINHTRPGMGGRGRTEPSQPGRSPHPCSRCGLTTRAELCRDCREVVAA